jgi:hypothetical protein
MARAGARLWARLRALLRALGRGLVAVLAAAGRALSRMAAGLLRRLRPRRLRAAWRLLGPEQRVAAGASVLLVASTPGPFSFVEAAVVLVALGVLVLLYARSEGRPFHLPLGDGGWVIVAGSWCAVLILARLLERPLGQSLLALACAGILVLAGARERMRRPADDLPRRYRARAGLGPGPT